MGMVVRTNTMAINANRQLSNNSNAVAKSLEKLSSGYRINRAGDDASGLAISEKMKAQIKGLEQASNNSQDGISLIQTAEGALTEVHNMLNRMVELATKSANGTIQDDVDRENIQNEVDALTQEINRIGNSTNFNGINLLDGSLSSKGSGAATLVGAPELGAPNNGISITDHDATATTSKMPTALVNITTGTGTGKNLTKIGDKVTYNLNYTDSKGNTKLATIVLTVKELSVAGAAGAAGNGVKLQAADGTIYEGTAANGTHAADEDFGGADIANALKAELEKDKDFSAEFEIKPGATAGTTLDFTAKNVGKNSQVNSLLQGFNDAASTVIGGINTAADDKGQDAYQSMGNVKYGDVFTLDGKSFAIFTDQTQFTDWKKGLSVEDQTKYGNVNAIFIGETNGNGANANDIGTAVTHVATADVGPSNIDPTVVQKLISQQLESVLGYDGVKFSATGTLDFKSPTTPVVDQNTSGPLTLQIGDTSKDYNKMSVEVNDMRADALGVGGVDVSNQTSAGTQIDVIRAAINTVSKTRGDLGALQNRLEYTINNLDTTAENMTAANSRIRDTDMAKEMMNYTKMNVLVQSAQAMLAQANQQPQSILQLLQ